MAGRGTTSYLTARLTAAAKIHRAPRSSQTTRRVPLTALTAAATRYAVRTLASCHSRRATAGMSFCDLVDCSWKTKGRQFDPFGLPSVNMLRHWIPFVCRASELEMQPRGNQSKSFHSLRRSCATQGVHPPDTRESKHSVWRKRCKWLFDV